MRQRLLANAAFTPRLSPASNVAYDPGWSSAAAARIHTHRVARDGGDYGGFGDAVCERIVARESKRAKRHLHGEPSSAGAWL